MTRPKWGGATAARLVALTLATFGRVCHLCGREGATTADHVIPRSKGGADALFNLRPAHRRCNQQRGDMPLNEWFAKHPINTIPPPSRQWFTKPIATQPITTTDR
ncbi:HNH endonuclease [Gordonia sp. CPCC 205333]|uniref:HNH endonuclease n=1 Tax=Gordonia sp. CPCC 205333 TaxID=3140790 RepID=UPI003AF3B30C